MSTIFFFTLFTNYTNLGPTEREEEGYSPPRIVFDADILLLMQQGGFPGCVFLIHFYLFNLYLICIFI